MKVVFQTDERLGPWSLFPDQEPSPVQGRGTQGAETAFSQGGDTIAIRIFFFFKAYSASQYIGRRYICRAAAILQGYVTDSVIHCICGAATIL
jgi:hypothetical protein